jgi:HSP20 family molecular chaperone IbpA
MEEEERRVFDLARRLAHERGPNEVFGVDDWFRAEAELREAPRVLCERSGGAFVVRVELPGVSLDDVVLGIERDELVLGIRGRRPAFRAIELPPGLDPARAVTSFYGDVLTVTVPGRREARAPESAKRPA